MQNLATRLGINALHSSQVSALYLPASDTMVQALKSIVVVDMVPELGLEPSWPAVAGVAFAAAIIWLMFELATGFL